MLPRDCFSRPKRLTHTDEDGKKLHKQNNPKRQSRTPQYGRAAP